MDQQANELRDLLDEGHKQLRVAEDRAKRAEQHSSDVQSELSKERSLNIELEKANIILEKSLKELSSRLYEFEGLNLARESTTTRRLESRLDELTVQLDNEQKEKNEALKNLRKSERTIRELQFQVQEKEKLKTKFDEDSDKLEMKLKKMKSQLEELVKFFIL